MLLSISLPVLLVEFGDLFVDQFVDIRLGFEASEEESPVLPSLASSSAFSFPQSQVWAAIHRNSTEFELPRLLRASVQSLVVLLLILSAETARIDGSLSVQIMMFLLEELVR